MTQKLIVDPLTISGLQTQVHHSLWAAYKNQNSDYVECLIGFHKMSLESRKKFFGVKSQVKSPKLFTNPYLRELYHQEQIFVDESGTTEGSGLNYVGGNTEFMFAELSKSKLGHHNSAESETETEKTQVKVFKMYRDADYKTVFTSLNKDVEGLCMSKAQIKSFCEKHKDKLRSDKYSTFFLFKEKNKLLVAAVTVDSDNDLFLYKKDYLDPNVWYRSGKFRLVVSAKGIRPPKA